MVWPSAVTKWLPCTLTRFNCANACVDKNAAQSPPRRIFFMIMILRSLWFFRRGNNLHPVERFQTHPRPVIRAFPFADFGQLRVGLAVFVDAPEPFAVNAVNQMLLDEIPCALRRLQKL